MRRAQPFPLFFSGFVVDLHCLDVNDPNITHRPPPPCPVALVNVQVDRAEGEEKPSQVCDRAGGARSFIHVEASVRCGSPLRAAKKTPLDDWGCKFSRSKTAPTHGREGGTGRGGEGGCLLETQMLQWFYLEITRSRSRAST